MYIKCKEKVLTQDTWRPSSEHKGELFAQRDRGRDEGQRQEAEKQGGGEEQKGEGQKGARERAKYCLSWGTKDLLWIDWRQMLYTGQG